MRGVLRCMALANMLRQLARGAMIEGDWLPPATSEAVELELKQQAVRKASGREKKHLHNIARRQKWTPYQSAYLEHVKLCVIGDAYKWPRRIYSGDDKAACAWDCYRRASMLEPLAAELLRHGVPGDFLEAGVLNGGVSIFMAALLRAHGELGRRQMWVADSFAGMPSQEYSARFASSASGRSAGIPAADLAGAMLGKKFAAGKLIGTLETVEANFRRNLLPFPAIAGNHSCGQSGGADAIPPDIQFVKGFFNETLPGKVKRLALLRIDSDIFSSIYETLEALYPLLSNGGFVVFDDWKIPQAQAAAVLYRKRYQINHPIWGSDSDNEPPFWSLDRMAFWQKGGDSTVRSRSRLNAQ